jgi:hypothetical protein
MDNQLVEHNAMTLISMAGALDAFVEGLAPRARKMLVEHQATSLVDRVRPPLLLIDRPAVVD